jgi:serine/threonine protein kinase
MQPPHLFCDECGAAHARDALTCFACGYPLAPSHPQETDVPQTSAEEQAPVAPLYLQFTLYPDSPPVVRVIEQIEPVPTVKLLHNRYEILGQAGTGGFGAVYKARDTARNNRLVAIKAIELDTLSAAQAIEATDTFNRELQMLSSLDHAHLPTIYEHFLDATHWYLAMDFIDGEPLDEYLKLLHEPCLPFREVIDIGLQLCDVLGYLHQRHRPIIFRDVKPANIMRTPGGRIYLIDFGIARRFTPGQKRDTTPLGSPGFAAPEQYGTAQTTARTDIYGLGATLYFLLTGHDPATTPFHLPPLLSLCPTLPPSLAALITAMLALDPDQRPADMAAVQQDLICHMPATYRATARSFQLRSAQLHASSRQQAPPSVPSSPPAGQRPTRLRRTSQFLRKLFGASLLTTSLQVAT